MLTILIAILGMILTILIVVGIHEFGHFCMARAVGVKVLRFSFGFGKPLLTLKDRQGTEYCLSAIPLGGYIKMLDEQEAPVPQELLPQAYNRQPLWKKSLIVAAGPATNILLALLLYWLIYWVGFNTIKPIIGTVSPHSIAANAGLQSHDEIVAIQDSPTNSWTAVILRLSFFVGGHQELKMAVKAPQTNIAHTANLDLHTWHVDNLRPDPLASLGIEPYMPTIPAIIGEISPNSPAARSPLRVGDKIVRCAGTAVHDWRDLLTCISQHPNQQVMMTVTRQSKTETLAVQLGSKKIFFKPATGYLGMLPQFTVPANLIRTLQYPPLPALGHAAENTYDYTLLNFILIGRMITGEISLKSLGGPITIFENAGSSLNNGVLPFLNFIAFISIAIGVINIIPIPGLDGGHLLLHGVESIIRRPLPGRIQNLLYRLGLILLLILIVQAMVNDISRLV